LSITLDCQAGDIAFYRKVSSEKDWDFLVFSIDDIPQDMWSGELDWACVSFPVKQGRHTFTWTYVKDDMYLAGQDCAWLDDIQFPLTSP